MESATSASLAAAYLAERVAVVRLGQAHEQFTARVPTQLPIFKGHLERNLDSGGARIRIENALQPSGSNIYQPFREDRCRRIGKPQHCAVIDRFELLPDCFRNFPACMPMNVAPER